LRRRVTDLLADSGQSVRPAGGTGGICWLRRRWRDRRLPLVIARIPGITTGQKDAALPPDAKARLAPKGPYAMRRRVPGANRTSGTGMETPLWATFHDAVVGATRPGAASAGAVTAEHLRRRPAVQLHQVPLGAAAVQPGVAEVMPEPVRPGIHPGLPAPAGDHLVYPVRGHRPPVVHPQPQLQPPPRFDRTRRYRSRALAASCPIRTTRARPPLPRTVISRRHKSKSLRRGSCGS